MTDALMMKYFVLKPRGENVFAKASREAMTVYARTIRDEAPVFAATLEQWVIAEEARVTEKRIVERGASLEREGGSDA